MADKSGRRKSTKRSPGSTTSLGKKRSLGKQRRPNNRPPATFDSEQQGSRDMDEQQGQQRGHDQQQQQRARGNASSSSPGEPTRSSSEYGSQASPMRMPSQPQHSNELTKVAILGAAGGIGQPLALLLMLHSEYVQHLALYDLVNVRGVGADLAHIDRQCRVTTHLGPDELAEAVRDAKVIVIPAGLAQKPGMTRDDLFGSNAKIMLNLAKVCAQTAPNAMLAIISNPVNSLVPLTCEVYHRLLSSSTGQQAAAKQAGQQQPQQKSGEKSEGKTGFHECFRRIFGVTTLDVVRSSTLSAQSAFFKPEPSGLFRDPSKITVPVVGGHAGKTIIPLLSQATPKFDKRRLQEDRSTTSALIDSIQQAGIEVLNAKKGTGSATLAMAYAACRFTISLLRAQQGEPNIVECAYVRQQHSPVADLDYFSCPLLLGKDGYTKSLGLGKLLAYEQQMVDEAAKELRSSVAKGEDFAREHLSLS